MDFDRTSLDDRTLALRSRTQKVQQQLEQPTEDPTPPSRPEHGGATAAERTAAEAEFLALGEGARLWLGEAAAAGRASLCRTSASSAASCRPARVSRESGPVAYRPSALTKEASVRRTNTAPSPSMAEALTPAAEVPKARERPVIGAARPARSAATSPLAPRASRAPRRVSKRPRKVPSRPTITSRPSMIVFTTKCACQNSEISDTSADATGKADCATSAGFMIGILSRRLSCFTRLASAGPVAAKQQPCSETPTLPIAPFRSRVAWDGLSLRPGPESPANVSKRGLSAPLWPT